ncbi:uncharacterized protein RJT20DRAFT_129501 [Scheffersomyces xylosifermentans]|uniref:uncharacterized protein n=1 Tax=Scheffersomyces xylosifermentans TaxID=1304137 RepID=UPI00315D97C2
MRDQSFYVNNYVKLVWVIMGETHSNSKRSIKKFHDFNNRYGSFIRQLIHNSQLSCTNLLISIYYLHKYYHCNEILKLDLPVEDDGDNMAVYLVVMALVLSNKSFDDQSYTLKTWLTIINSTISNNCQDEELIKVNLSLLNYLESYFLSCLNYKLSFNKLSEDTHFWKILANSRVFKLSSTIIQSLKSLVVEEETPYDIYSNFSAIASYIASPSTTPVSEKVPVTSFIPQAVPVMPVFQYQYSKPLAALDYRTPTLSSSFSSPSVSRDPSTCNSSKFSYTSTNTNKLVKGIYSPLTPLTPYNDDQTNYYASSIKRRKFNHVNCCHNWVQSQQQHEPQQMTVVQQPYITSNAMAPPALPYYYHPQQIPQFPHLPAVQQNPFWS